MCAGSRRLLDTPTAHAIASLTLAAHASLTASSADEKGQGGKDKKGGEKAAADANREARAAKLGGAAGVKGVKLSWLLYSGGKLVICGGKDTRTRTHTHTHSIAQRSLVQRAPVLCHVCLFLPRSTARLGRGGVRVCVCVLACLLACLLSVWASVYEIMCACRVGWARGVRGCYRRRGHRLRDGGIRRGEVIGM